MSVTFQPLRNGVLLALEPTPERSKLIAVQQSLEDLVRFATVVAVGPDVKDAKVGQKVLANITAGVEVPGGHLINEGAIIVTDAKSRTGSYGNFGYSAGPTAIGPTLPSNSV